MAMGASGLRSSWPSIARNSSLRGRPRGGRRRAPLEAPAGGARPRPPGEGGGSRPARRPSAAAAGTPPPAGAAEQRSPAETSAARSCSRSGTARRRDRRCSIAPQIESAVTASSATLVPVGPKRTAAQSSIGNGQNNRAGWRTAGSDELPNTAAATTTSASDTSAASNSRAAEIRGNGARDMTRRMPLVRNGRNTRAVIAFESHQASQTSPKTRSGLWLTTVAAPTRAARAGASSTAKARNAPMSAIVSNRPRPAREPTEREGRRTGAQLIGDLRHQHEGDAGAARPMRNVVAHRGRHQDDPPASGIHEQERGGHDRVRGKQDGGPDPGKAKPLERRHPHKTTRANKRRGQPCLNGCRVSEPLCHCFRARAFSDGTRPTRDTKMNRHSSSRHASGAPPIHRRVAGRLDHTAVCSGTGLSAAALESADSGPGCGSRGLSSCRRRPRRTTARRGGRRS